MGWNVLVLTKVHLKKQSTSEMLFRVYSAGTQSMSMKMAASLLSLVLLHLESCSERRRQSMHCGSAPPRAAPRHPAPTALEVPFLGIRTLRRHGSDLGRRCTRITRIRSSAGWAAPRSELTFARSIRPGSTNSRYFFFINFVSFANIDALSVTARDLWRAVGFIEFNHGWLERLEITACLVCFGLRGSWAIAVIWIGYLLSAIKSMTRNLATLRVQGTHSSTLLNLGAISDW